MNFQEKYEEFSNIIEKKIQSCIIKKFPETLYDALSYIMSGGGKRIRPVLTLITAACISEKYDEKKISDAASAGLAIEILHNFTLVHDDIMDNSTIRRGRETLHVKYSEEVAILTGDMMVGYAFSVLPVDSHGYNNLVRILSESLIKVCEGQQLDVEFNARKNVTMSEYMDMIELKTSALLQASANLGAVVAGATSNQCLTISEFAKNLGYAFQIQDDLLDMTAEQIKFGKKIGQDILEGKKSFPIIKAIELATDKTDKELLERYLTSKTGLPEDYIPKFRELFDKLNIFEIGQKYIDNYSIKSITCLLDLPQNKYTEMLQWLVNLLNKRVY